MAVFTGVILVCGSCGKEFKVPKCRSKSAKYCSNDCADRYRNEGKKKQKIVLICLHCDKEFEAYQCHRKRRKFCSYECKDKHAEQSGDLAIDRHFYNRAFWDRLRKEVVKRDGHTCQHCGLHGKGLHAHHLISKFLGGQDEMDNLITLCNSCHKKAHCKA